ncbi:MAG: methylmalonyl-CoA mutase, partial [Gemmatimonadetes bacterium]|nr:methylmalonyl-CoA mutase [Gemmatimonadota bacterium]
VVDVDHAVEVLKVGDEADLTQRRRLAALRARRDGAKTDQALERLEQAAERDQNVIPAMLDCARADCTLFEIRHALEEVYGAYREPIFF